MSVQGKEFTSWKEVFPDAEEGGEGGAAGQEYVLPTDSDEDDDESFNVRSNGEIKSIWFDVPVCCEQGVDVIERQQIGDGGK